MAQRAADIRKCIGVPSTCLHALTRQRHSKCYVTRRWVCIHSNVAEQCNVEISSGVCESMYDVTKYAVLQISI